MFFFFLLFLHFAARNLVVSGFFFALLILCFRLWLTKWWVLSHSCPAWFESSYIYHLLVVVVLNPPNVLYNSSHSKRVRTIRLEIEFAKQGFQNFWNFVIKSLWSRK